MFHKQCRTIIPLTKNTFNNSNGKHKWFGQNCKKSRKLYNKARNKITKYPTAYNKLTLQNTSKTYKATMNKYIKKIQQRKCKKVKNPPKQETKRLLEITK